MLLFELEVNFSCQILKLHEPKYTLHCYLLLSRLGAIVPKILIWFPWKLTANRQSVNGVPFPALEIHGKNLQYEISLREIAWDGPVIRTCDWLALDLL